MKIKVLYEDDIINGHKVYTTIEVPDDDYTVILDLDYEQRLAEVPPEKRDSVKRCGSLQEVFDLMNNKEYNNWRRQHRYLGKTKAQSYEDDGTGSDGENGSVWLEPLMEEVADERIYLKDEIERDQRQSYEEICSWVRKTLAKKPKWADAFIAVRLDGVSVNDHAASIGVSDASIVSKWLARAEKKLREHFSERQI